MATAAPQSDPSAGYDHVPPPHPYLTQPLLYISNLPRTVTDEQLAVAFQACIPFRPRLARDNGEQLVGGTIEFRHLDAAERALATLSTRPIPNVHPQATFSLSPFPPNSPPAPAPTATPRLIKHLPPLYTPAHLFDLFRPFGPIASASTSIGHLGLGGEDTGVIEFYREEDAKLAEANMHCAEVESPDGESRTSIAVQVYQPRRASSAAHATEFNTNAPPFIPSGSIGAFAQHQPYSPPRPYQASLPRSSPIPGTPPHGVGFVHGPGQQVQYAPMHGPGSSSHSGLIDPCNLFCKNLDPDIDSNALFSHFRVFGQIVSARVMRDESGRSRGFGFVSYQTPDQAAAALHAMNGMQLGSKQLIVRLHEPKQLRQEKLAARFAGTSPRSNNHPRSRSGATSPTASEGGDSFSGWASPSQVYSGLSSPGGYAVGVIGGAGAGMTPERARRSSGSYYNAALAGHLNMSLAYDDLASLSPVVRREVLQGELQRRVKTMPNVPGNEVDAIVDALIDLNLREISEGLQDTAKLQDQVTNVLTVLHPPPEPSPSPQPESLSKKRPESPSPAASQDSRLLDPKALDATASAPEHPSTPVSSTSLSTPPRSSSPGTHPPSAPPGSHSAYANAPLGGGPSERDRIAGAVAKLEADAEKREAIVELIMGLGKRERAMCLFNGEVLRAKVADARAVLESEEGEDDGAALAPVLATPITKRVVSGGTDSPRTPDLSSRGPSAAASPAQPATPPPAIASTSSSTSAGETTYTLASLARLPASQIISLIRSKDGPPGGLPLPKEDLLVVRATDEFIDGLAKEPVPKQKQAVGDKLFKVIKSFGLKGAPKVTIALLDGEDLRALAHLMNSYPSVLREKVILAGGQGK